LCLHIHFFLQAEDGIRDATVTGVQTCALPISRPGGRHAGCSYAIGRGENSSTSIALGTPIVRADDPSPANCCPTSSACPPKHPKIGRASCRESASLDVYSA